MSSVAQSIPANAAAGKSSPYLQKGFIGAVIVLAAAAAVLNIMVFNRDLHFKKLAVPPARKLEAIAPQLGEWTQVSLDEALDPDVQEVLGTDQYIYRDYLNLPSHGGQAAAALIDYLYAADRKHGGDMRDQYLNTRPEDRPALLERELKNKTSEQRKGALLRVQQQYPDSVINMGITYYTGLVDTVAHVPDRCYIASGYEPTSDPAEPVWSLADNRQLQVRYLSFEDQTQNGAGNISKNVAYFFHVNGHYECNPLGVRLSLQNLFVKYGYYLKVELMTLDANLDESTQTMKSFLVGALPEVEKTYPNWQKLTETAGK